MDFDDLKMILAPTDLSDASAPALRAAVRLAQMFHASVEVFHVDIDPSLVLPPPIGVVSMAALFERMFEGAAEKLNHIVDEVRKSGVVCTGASEYGRSHAAIVEQATRTGAGLIVMGSHARPWLSHALVGSVAEKVVQHAPCAVLVVPVAGAS
ncbi:MAG TPA: universal stress protein [Polyangia bacterium]|nr:universal stress protein [Polyangia bacterium]